MIRSLFLSAAALAMVAGAGAPASARPYWGGYRHHRGGGDTVGKLILGAIIGGGAVAIASQSNRDRPTPSRRADDQRDDIRESGDDARQVASLCSNAVENMAHGPVSSVDSVGRDTRDGWRVQGVVRGDRGDRNFRCSVRDGQIEMVDMAERVVASR